jgi:hypothetical protein
VPIARLAAARATLKRQAEAGPAEVMPVAPAVPVPIRQDAQKEEKKKTVRHLVAGGGRAWPS